MSNKSKTSKTGKQQRNNGMDKDLEARKKQLEAELERIEQELDTSVDEMRTDITDRVNPRNIINRYPLHALGSSVLLGLLVGYRGRSSNSSKRSDGRSLFDLAWRELKTTATRRAVRSFFKYLDGKIDEQLENNLSGTQEGEEE